MAWVEQLKGGWRGMYRDETGRKHSAGRDTSKRRAMQLALDEEAKLRGGMWIDPMAGRITFSDYFETQWLPNKVAEKKTLATYRSHYNAALKPEFGDVELRRILPTTVQGWVKRMVEAGVSPGTIRIRVRVLQTVLAGKKGGSALTDRLIAHNPCAAVALPTAPEREVAIYTPDEVERLVDALDPWWLPLIVLDVDTGLRWGELMGLQVEDFSLGFRSLTVRRTVGELTKKDTGNGTRFYTKQYPKGKKPRLLALSPEVGALIDATIRERALTVGDRLFSMPDKKPPPDWHPPLTLEWMPRCTDEWPHGLPISRSYFRTFVWLPAIEKAKVPRRRFHDLRATNISWLLAGTQNVPMVMERVGHTVFNTTRRYMQVLQEADNEAVTALAAVKARYRRT